MLNKIIFISLPHRKDILVSKVRTVTGKVKRNYDL